MVLSTVLCAARRALMLTNCPRRTVMICAGIFAAGAAAAAADTLELPAAKDNTLYFSLDTDYSNGVGEHFIAGDNANGDARRAVLAFDLSSVPSGATLEAAELRLYLSRTSSGPSPVALHRLLADWGEGASDAVGEEGFGAPSEPGDASWWHGFFDTQLWTTPGGDYVPGASAITTVDQIGSYSWSGPGVLGDVQAWLADAGANFGWILIGDESQIRTAKRFDSRENPEAAQRPILVLTYSAPAACPGDMNCDAAVDFADIDPFVLSLSGEAAYLAQFPDCRWLNGDANADSTVDFADIDPFVGLLFTTCP